MRALTDHKTLGIAYGLTAGAFMLVGFLLLQFLPDKLLGLFSAASVGRDVVLEPATQFDMCGKTESKKETLEVVYDAV